MNGILLHSREKGQTFEFVAELDVADDSPWEHIFKVAKNQLPGNREIRRSLVATPTVAPVVREYVGQSTEQALADLRARGFRLDRWCGLWVIKPKGNHAGSRVVFRDVLRNDHPQSDDIEAEVD